MEKWGNPFIGCQGEYDGSKIVLFGVPFDGTASYRPGSRFAPAAIRNESYGIETYSPYIDRDLETISVFDGGDLELPFGNPERVLAMVEERTAEIAGDGKIPCMLGGEHLVTLGAVRALAKLHPGLRVIQLDAHTDLREDYLGEKLSHATVMRRCHDLLGDGRIFQLGIRSGEKAEFEFAKTHTRLYKFNLDGLTEALGEIGDKPLYFTLDLDVLDPSAFPGTGTPEAGGISFEELRRGILEVGKHNIVGLDINELCPPCDLSGMSTGLACKVLRESLLSLSPLITAE